MSVRICAKCQREFSDWELYKCTACEKGNLCLWCVETNRHPCLHRNSVDKLAGQAEKKELQMSDKKGYIQSRKADSKKYRKVSHIYDVEGKRLDAYFDPTGNLYLEIQIDDRHYSIAFSHDHSKRLAKRLCRDTLARAQQLLEDDSLDEKERIKS